MSNATTRTVLEVLPEPYDKVKDRAKKHGISLKLFTSLLLDYAVQKLDAGQIELVEPTMADRAKSAPSPKATRKIPSRHKLRKGRSVA